MKINNIKPFSTAKFEKLNNFKNTFFKKVDSMSYRNQAKLVDEFVLLHPEVVPYRQIKPSTTPVFWFDSSPNDIFRKYFQKTKIQEALKKDPEIASILEDYGLKPKIYMKNLNIEAQKHFKDTYYASLKLGKINNLTANERRELSLAALLHDIGKSLIPSSIIDKPGKLSDKEREIIDLHAELGARILKTQGLSQNVVNMVGLHHEPCCNPKKAHNIPAQILSVCDQYSALSEKRAYKSGYSQNKVKGILEENSEGKSLLNPDIVFQLTNES